MRPTNYGYFKRLLYPFVRTSGNRLHTTEKYPLLFLYLLNAMALLFRALQMFGSFSRKLKKQNVY